MGHNTTTTTQAEAPATRIVTTAKAAASALGIDRGTLYEWFAKGCPRGEEGRFDVEAILAWRESTLRPPTTYDPRRREGAEREARRRVADIATRFGCDVVGPESVFSRLLARWPRWKREFLAVDMLQFLAGIVEDYEPVNRTDLFAELGLADAGAKYHDTYTKLGLSSDE